MSGKKKSEPEGLIEPPTEADFEVTVADLKKSNVPPLFFNATREEILNMGVPYSMKSEYRIAWRYANEILENAKLGKGLLLQGSVGTTKTTLAVAILQEALKCRLSGYFLSMIGVLRFFNSKRDQHREEFARLQNKLISCSVLVLDDLGAEYLNDWDKDHVDYIIGERYNRKKALIITTNLREKDIAAKYGERIYDRLRAMCGEPILLVGESLRKGSL